jgi:autophagy-related protein 9
MTHRFEDQDLEQLLAEAAVEEDDMPRPGRIRLPDDDIALPFGRNPTASRAGGRSDPAQAITDGEEDDDDVPESLILGVGGKSERRRRRRSKPGRDTSAQTTPAPGPETHKTRQQWETTQAQQQLHRDYSPVAPSPAPRQRNMLAPRIANPMARKPDPQTKALWMWSNVDNLDQFLRLVYAYYEEHGIWSILLSRAITMA